MSAWLLTTTMLLANGHAVVHVSDFKTRVDCSKAGAAWEAQAKPQPYSADWHWDCRPAVQP